MSLTKEQILQADDLKYVDVPVPEWGGDVRVRIMTGRQRQQFQVAYMGKKGMDEVFMERLVMATAVNGDGESLFTEADLEELSKKSSIALNRIFEAAAHLNGMTQESVEEIKGE